MSGRIRYIVCGLVRDIDVWRRQRGLSPRDVIPVSTTQGGQALRGLSGRFELVVLESWSQATPDTRSWVDANLAVLRRVGHLPGEAILTRHDDGTVTVDHADPLIRVTRKLLDAAEPWAWNGETLTLDTAGTYRYRELRPDPLDDRVLIFERIHP